MTGRTAGPKHTTNLSEIKTDYGFICVQNSSPANCTLIHKLFNSSANDRWLNEEGATRCVRFPITYQLCHETREMITGSYIFLIITITHQAPRLFPPNI
jgi:hypothetical protein